MIIKRILQIVEHEGISKRRFYAKTGLSNGFLDKPTKDVGVSKVETILKVFPYINPLWLFLGEGEMVVKNFNTDAPKMIVGNKGKKQDDNSGSLCPNTKEVEYLKSKIELLEKALEDKNERLKDKEELISMLRNNLR